MRIVILDGEALNPGDLSWDGFAALGDLTVYGHTLPGEIVPRIGDAEIVITNKTMLGRDVFEQCPSIRYIGILSTGYNVVDLDAARERGIPVTNVPAYSTEAVAQYVFALLLELTSHVGRHSRAVAEGRWAACRDFCFWDAPLMELHGKTMGIIGYGHIGQAAARIARAFGMRVLIHSPHAQGDEAVDLDTLLHESDVISLHCPLNERSQGLICRETLAKMKPGVLLINTARGGLVNESDLRDALLSGRVGGAAVDVVSREPMGTDNPLFGLENCLITPHVAWASFESRQRLLNTAVNNTRAFLDGHPVNDVTRL